MIYSFQVFKGVFWKKKQKETSSLIFLLQERLSKATDQLKDFNLKLKEATDLLVAKDQVVKDLQKQVEAAEQEAQEYWKLLAVADRKTEEQKLQSVGDSGTDSKFHQSK